MAPLNIFTLSALGLLAQNALAAKVVEMPLRSRSKAALAKRDFTTSLQNYLPGLEYFAAVQVGTPPQDLELIVDTGSSDIWMFAPNVCSSTTAYGPCIGGTYDSSKSKTYVLQATNQFQINYADGSGVTGDYIKDTFIIAGQNVTSQIMGVATQDSSNTAGIMGIGLDTRESTTNYGGSPYSNLPDSMKSLGLISTKAYSLYLDDSESQAGSLLFGGYDTAKYYGDLTILDLIPDETGTISAFSVDWVSLGVTTSNGSIAIESTRGAFPAAATLDSGSTLISLPAQVYSAVASIFSVDSSGLVACDLMNEVGFLSFGFGSAEGPVIAVPFSELARPIYDGNGDWEVDSTGDKVCEFGIASAADNGGDLLFGQTLLRSAYVLYDLDNQKVGLAQARYDATTSSIVEYTGPSGTGIQTLSGATVTPSATATFQGTSDGVSDIFGSFTTSAVPVSATVSIPKGASSIAAGVVAYPTTVTVSQPVVPNSGFPKNAASLTSIGAAGGRRYTVEGAGVFAALFFGLFTVFGGGLLVL